jgi:hypothetical protein
LAGGWIRAFGYGWHIEREGVVLWCIAIDGRNFILVDLSQHLHSEFQWDEAASNLGCRHV